jgi:hypothetical protein
MEHAVQNGPLSLSACTRSMAAATQNFNILPDDALQAKSKWRKRRIDDDARAASAWRSTDRRRQTRPQSLASLDNGRDLGRLARSTKCTHHLEIIMA